MADEQNQAGEGSQVGAGVQTTPQNQAGEGAQTTPQNQEAQAQQGVSKNDQEQKAEMPDLLGKTTEGEAVKSGAPEKYEAFKLGEDTVVESEGLQAFSEAARKHGLSQEAAQEFVDSLAPSVENHLKSRVVEQAKHWAEEAEADKEIGGSDFKANIATAKKAYDHYATDELRHVLTATGLSNHPEVLRLFYRLGKNLQQDSGVNGSPSTAQETPTWYPNSPQMRR